MDAQQIVDMLLQSGQELVNKGKTLAEQKLNLPDDPEQRQKMLDGAGKGAIAASALALLLGTSSGRKLTGASLKLGSLAALGTVAYQAFQKWQNQEGQVASDVTPSTLSGTPVSDAQSKTLLKAMIAAAKADGHVDENERNAIVLQVEKLGLGDAATAMIVQELNQPLDIDAVVADVNSPEQAAEIYLISRAVLDVDNDQEKAYLQQLATALKLAPSLVAELENQVTKA